jgi:hypothetical protein
MIAHTMLLAKLSLEGKNDGCGTPEGLPLISRFSDLTLPSPERRGVQAVNSMAKWRTLILVNFVCVTKVHALSFPITIIFRYTSNFMVCRDYTVKKSPA